VTCLTPESIAALVAATEDAQAAVREAHNAVRDLNLATARARRQLEMLLPYLQSSGDDDDERGRQGTTPAGRG
jgi:hypothetical protein